MQGAAGGAAITMPSEKDFISPITGKYIENTSRVPTEHRIRARWPIEDKGQ